jgi:hypothetical protein
VSDLWPWFALAGLGLFHGINPAMGWLFAVGLGLHRNAFRTVLVSLIPIALGHALAIGATLALVMALGAVIDLGIIGTLCGAALILWALWHALYGHRHRVRFGMTTGLVGLGMWSFLMANAHGAGLMLVPVFLPLHAAHHQHGVVTDSFTTALVAVLVHTGAMLAATAIIAIIVYRWIGVAVLRRGWINFDILWVAMLLVSGVLLLWSSLA